MLTKKFLISIGIVATILGCNSPSKSSHHLKEYAVKTRISNCNSETNKTRSTHNNSIMTNDHTYIAYLYEEDKKILTLTHYNAQFNCDKRGIEARFFLNNDTIKIVEKQNLPEGAGVYCMCLYDITVQIEDIIEAKKYTIIYDDGYSDDIHFDIDLAKETRGEKSFVRTKYPYNTRSTKW